MILGGILDIKEVAFESDLLHDLYHKDQTKVSNLAVIFMSPLIKKFCKLHIYSPEAENKANR